MKGERGDMDEIKDGDISEGDVSKPRDMHPVVYSIMLALGCEHNPDDMEFCHTKCKNADCKDNPNHKSP